MIRARLTEPLPDTAPAEARLLARCAARGLPVAASALLLDVADGPAAELACALGPLPPGTVDLVGLPGAAVRDVPTDDVAALAAALRTLRGTAVLVQPPPAAVHAGLACLRHGTSYDVVRAVEGRAHELDGADEVRTLHVPRLAHRWSRPHRGADEWRTPLPPWAMRLSRVLRRVAETVAEEVDVEWADDGRRVHLLGVRPAS